MNKVPGAFSGLSLLGPVEGFLRRWRGILDACSSRSQAPSAGVGAAGAPEKVADPIATSCVRPALQIGLSALSPRHRACGSCGKRGAFSKRLRKTRSVFRRRGSFHRPALAAAHPDSGA